MPSESFGFFDDDPPEQKENKTTEAKKDLRFDESPSSTSADSEFEENLAEHRSYLFFRVASNQYATKLMSIQEIIEVPPVKQIPRSVDYLAGVFNLRGEVSGLIDLQARLGSGPTKASSETAVLVFQTQHGAIGAIVDHIFGVKIVSESDIKVNSSIQTRVNERYLGGFLHSEDEIIIIVDLQKLLDEDEFKQVDSFVKHAG